MRVVFLGPPGAGKGTQAEAICGEFDLVHISTGDLLRKAVADGTKLGREAKGYMESGGLVPDDMIVVLVVEALRNLGPDKGFLLDGFPRTIAQAESLNDSLSDAGSSLDLVIYFETSEGMIIDRLSGRRTCRDCGGNFHVRNIPPRVDGVCDRCGGELYQRADDTLETIKERIKVYHEETGGLISYYRDKDMLAEVSGDKGVDELRPVLVELLNAA